MSQIHYCISTKIKCKNLLNLNFDSLRMRKYRILSDFPTILRKEENKRNMRAYFQYESLCRWAFEGKILCLAKNVF